MEIEIHDHLDGTAHCIECRGDCTLPPQSFAASEFIRNLLESLVWNGWTELPSQYRESLSAWIGNDKARAMWGRAFKSHRDLYLRARSRQEVASR